MCAFMSCYFFKLPLFQLKIQTSRVEICEQASCTSGQHSLNCNITELFSFFLGFYLPLAGLRVVYLEAWQKVDSDTGNVELFWSERVKALLESSPCLSGRIHILHFELCSFTLFFSSECQNPLVDFYVQL